MKHNDFSRNFRIATTLHCRSRSLLGRNGRRYAHSDTFQRRTNFWTPPVILGKGEITSPDATLLLTRAGYVRQAHSGIYHLLPLGLRVQNKLERLIDKYMSSIGASKVSLSSVSSQELWERSGRLASGTEIFKFTDRRGGKFLLSPTHEEEITSLVSSTAQSYKDLPIRVYQIGRKYRDEKRPRGGLLRGREFLMKDLYTFDGSEAEARATYDAVRRAYAGFFDELGVDFLEARADSGNMGGSLSHEYHLPHASGEDDIIQCSNCGFARNEELLEEVDLERKPIPKPLLDLKHNASKIPRKDVTNLMSYSVITTDHKTLVRAFAAQEAPSPNASGTFNAQPPEFNKAAIKSAFASLPDLDTGIEGANGLFLDSVLANKSAYPKQPHTIHYLFDGRIDSTTASAQLQADYDFLRDNEVSATTVTSSQGSSNRLNLLKSRTGDACPSCQQEKLEIHKAIEVGHTFHLGTRYSSKLGAKVLQGDGSLTDIEMGCHGIGVSRLVAAVAACLLDDKGLNWPSVIAPFQVAILCGRVQSAELDEAAINLSEKLTAIDPERAIDVLYDDRTAFNLGWKLNDADTIGYPVIVVFGKLWESGEGKVEIQCRRLKVKANVLLADAPDFVQNLLQSL